MTESFKNMLKNAKTVDEAYDIVCAHADEFTMNEQIKIFQLATGRSELTDDELDMVVGGSLWSSIKKAVNTFSSVVSSAVNTAVDWASEHKKIALAIVGAVAGIALFGIGVAAGLIAATTVAEVAFGTIFCGSCGATIGATIGLGLSSEKTKVI